MNTIWENVKQSVEQGTKVVKEFATTVSDKTQEMVKLSQLKLKYYNLNRDVSNKFTELGRPAYKLLNEKSKNIYANSEIIKLLSEISELEKDIKKLEHEMEDLKEKEPDEI